jgi:hypothetical protein
MLVAVAILAAFLAYNANWLRQRRQFVEDLRQNHPQEYVYISSGDAGYFSVNAPFPLWIFGEKGVGAYNFNLDLGETDRPLSQEEYSRRLQIADEAAPIAEARRLFPEARVYTSGYVQNAPSAKAK